MYEQTNYINVNHMVFLGVSYSQIAPDGNRCGKEGTTKWPNRCSTYNIRTRSRCETECTQYSGCIGYSHQKSDPNGNPFCYLFKSNPVGSCPSGYIHQLGPTVMSVDQLSGVPTTDGFSGCYGKFAGNNKVHLGVAPVGSFLFNL